jgi:sortase B
MSPPDGSRGSKSGTSLEEPDMYVSEKLRRIILAAAACVFLFCAYKVASYYSDAQRNQKNYAELRQLYDKTPRESSETDESKETVTRPSAAVNLVQTTDNKPILTSELAEKPPEIMGKFKPLLKKNPDVVGWLNIPGMSIEYPVVQAADNEYYLSRGIDQKANVNGSIFMDFRNSIKKTQENTIIYGHNMKNKSMFYGLLLYQSKWNFDHHSVIEFDTLYKTEKWQIFSAYFTDIHDDYIRPEFKDKEEFKRYLENIRKKSLHASDVEVSENDEILTLSTCSALSSISRFTVHAKRIE